MPRYVFDVLAEVEVEQWLATCETTGGFAESLKSPMHYAVPWIVIIVSGSETLTHTNIFIEILKFISVLNFELEGTLAI